MFYFQTLRLWPAHLGKEFNCDSQDCKIPKEEMMYNSGYNRLNCFDCDYNLCMTCANRMVCQKQSGKTGEKLYLDKDPDFCVIFIQKNIFVSNIFHF